MPTYPTEHSDIYLLDDLKELGYNLDGTNYSLHPSPIYIAGEPIVKGHAVSIGTQTFALAEGLSASDAGKIFQSEQTNTDKCIGIAINGGVYGQTITTLDHGFYLWQTTSLLIATITVTTNGTITINGYVLTSTGATGSASQIATNIATVWTALSSSIKNGYTVIANGANIEVSSATASNVVPTLVAGTITFSPSWYANRTTTTVAFGGGEVNRTVLVNGVSSATFTVATSATVTATNIYNALNGAITGYALANPSAGVVTITTTISTLGAIPTIYVGGSAPFAVAGNYLTSTYQYTIFQPSDIGNTVYIAALHQTTTYSPSQDMPTSVTFLVQNNGVAEASSYFSLNGVQAGTISGTNNNSIAATIAALSYTGFTLSNPSANIVTITATNVSHTAPNYFITSFYIGNAAYTNALNTSPNTQCIPTFMDFLPTVQFTTNRALAVANGAPLIEVGLVKDLNTIFIDFEGDTRGAVNLSQISAFAGEPLPVNLSTSVGSPPIVAIGTDGNAYIADRRKANGGGTSNRNNVAGFLVGANIGYTNYSNPDNTVTVTSGTGTFASGTIVTSANPSSASVPNTGVISVTLSGVILSYTYNGYVSGSRTYSVTGMAGGPNTNPTALAGATVWSGTVPQGISVVIQKAGVISGFNATLSVGAPLYADYNGAYNQTLNAFSFYTDVVNPMGFATTANSVYVEVGFNTQKTDTGTIGSQYWMSPTATFADYGAVPCTTGLTITGNGGGQAGQLNAFGTTIVTAGTGMQTGTYDFTSLYAQIGTMYGGYSVWVITNFSAASGTAYLNGIGYAIGVPASNNDLAAKIATAIGTVGTYVCTNPSTNYVAITNDATHLPPNFSITVGTAIATPSSVNGGNTGTTFALPNLNGGSAKFQMRYINNFLYNPPTAPFFRWDSGWTAWGSIPTGCTGVASQYLEIPTTQFGSDIAATEVFAELYVQSTGSTQIFQINPNPINDGSGHAYGYSLSKDIASNLRIDFAANGLAYNTYGGGFANITGLTNPAFRIFIYKIEKFNKFYAHTGDQQLAQLWSLGLIDLLVADTVQGAGYLDRSVTQPSHTTRLNYDGDFYATDLLVSNNFTVSNTTGATLINGTQIQLRASTATGTQIGGAVNYLTVDNSGVFSTGFNVNMTGTGVFTIAGTSTYNGISTHNANLIVTSSATFSVGSTSQLSVSAAGTLTTTGNLSTTGSGTLSIAGLATFNGNAVIQGNPASLDDTTGSAVFNLLASPPTINFGAAATAITIGALTGTTTIRSPTLVISSISSSITGGIQLGDTSTAGVLTLSDKTATLSNYSSITNNAYTGAGTSYLTFSNPDTSSYMSFKTADATPTLAERFKIISSEIKISNIAIGTTTQNNANTNAILHLQSPTINDDVAISFDVGVGNYMSKLVFSKTDHSFHFGGASDLTDKGTVVAGIFNATSLRSGKENIQHFDERATDILSAIDVVSFNFRGDEKRRFRVGFIADDTHEYLSGQEHDKMDITNTLGLLIKAVQELKMDINKMKEKI